MDEFIAGTTQHPFARHLRIWNNSVGFEVSAFNGVIDLGAIMSFIEKGAGHASQALKWFTDLADKHGVDIELAVQPIKNAGDPTRKSLTKAQLTAWYRRHGFKSTGGEYMLRKAKSIAESIAESTNSSPAKIIDHTKYDEVTPPEFFPKFKALMHELANHIRGDFYRIGFCAFEWKGKIICEAVIVPEQHVEHKIKSQDIRELYDLVVDLIDGLLPDMKITPFVATRKVTIVVGE